MLRKTHKLQRRPPFECIALLLQGGGALGAYQGGVYQALDEARVTPDWVAGISIGAINSAIIAGNETQLVTEKLRTFWEAITSENPYHPFASAIAALPQLFEPVADLGHFAREIANQISANVALMHGSPGFFKPRAAPPWFHPPGSLGATSYYEHAGLKATLERFIDFDRLNAAEMRFSIGAVNVSKGNLVYFDNRSHTITAEHVMASAALPPGLPAVEVDGEFYWDGGLVSNTPLRWVLEYEPREDTLAFQVDLWSARGIFPRTMPEVMIRQKEIQYSSRTRANSDRFRYAQTLRNALAELLPKLPEELKSSHEYRLLSRVADRKVYNLVQLIYRSKQYEGHSKDYEFSRLSMKEHWRSGYEDTVRTLRHPEVVERPRNSEGVFTFDLHRDGRE